MRPATLDGLLNYVDYKTQAAFILHCGLYLFGDADRVSASGEAVYVML